MALTHDDVRELAAFRAGDAAVVSLYLNVDGRRYPRPYDYEAQLEYLLRTADGNHFHAAGAAKDLDRIESFVRAGLDRSRTRGLAVFSSCGAGLWRVIKLPVPVRNQLRVNDSPQVRQLEALLDDNERFGVLLVDRQRTRLLVFELGELVDKSEMLEQLPRREDEGGDLDRDPRVSEHLAAHVHQHLRRAAQVAFQAHQERPFDHFVLAAPDDVLPELEHDLHAYLRERIVARLNLPVAARDEEIRLAVLAVEERVSRERQAALVSRLRNAVGAGGAAWVSSGGTAAPTTARPGVAGLEAVLGALNQRRVDTLLVGDDYVAPGWRCSPCGALAGRGRTCALCGAEMIEADDVVEEAVDQTLALSGRVVVCTGNADLDVLGRIGALLRY